jgi:hypothetical protein
MKRAGRADSIKRGQLVDTALKFICRCRHWGTTVEEIRAPAPASTGSAFHHFSNKEGLALDSLATGAVLGLQIARAIAGHGRPVASLAQLAQFRVSHFEGSLILLPARQDVTIVENALHRCKWHVGGLLGLLAPAQSGTSASQRSAIEM